MKNDRSKPAIGGVDGQRPRKAGPGKEKPVSRFYGTALPGVKEEELERHANRY